MSSNRKPNHGESERQRVSPVPNSRSGSAVRSDPTPSSLSTRPRPQLRGE